MKKFAELLAALIIMLLKIGVVALAVYMMCLAAGIEKTKELTVIVIALSIINATFPINVRIQSNDKTP